LNENQNISLFRTVAVAKKIGDDDSRTFICTVTDPFTVIEREKHEEKISVWIYIVSVIGGLLSLVLLILGLKSCGFFKRLKFKEPSEFEEVDIVEGSMQINQQFKASM
jgi:hypothetical protein